MLASRNPRTTDSKSSAASKTGGVSARPIPRSGLSGWRPRGWLRRAPGRRRAARRSRRAAAARLRLRAPQTVLRSRSSRPGPWTARWRRSGSLRWAAGLAGALWQVPRFWHSACHAAAGGHPAPGLQQTHRRPVRGLEEAPGKPACLPCAIAWRPSAPQLPAWQWFAASHRLS